MNESNRLYESPLVARNASREMSELFGTRRRIIVWRSLWVTLAEAQRELGLPISARQISALKRGIEKIDFDVAAAHESRLRHDVMAHVHAFGDAVPAARSILHLGATSAFIVDNADLILMREALERVADWLVAVIDQLAVFAKRHRSMPCLGFTHYQPAQLTTVGKRATLWCWDFVRDLDEVRYRIGQLRFRGVKGTTGTQASFLELFGGSHAKVKRLETMVASAFGFRQCEPVTGQTYSRKVDAQVAATLAGVAQSVHKIANDLRLLSNLKEIEEPFEKSQVGSSAMAYKRNPMRMERATGLARLVQSLATSPQMTASEQWFERTLDDSANKRVAIPELFLATDGMLRLVHNVTGGLVVYPKMILKRVREELPFIATENIMMAASRAGGDRQELHEVIRVHAHAAGAQVKQHGKENDLIERLKADKHFQGVEFDKVLEPARYVGRAPQQVDEFLTRIVGPIRRSRRRKGKISSKLSV